MADAVDLKSTVERRMGSSPIQDIFDSKYLINLKEKIMCQFYSCIVLRDGTILDGSDHHTEIIAKYSSIYDLKDTDDVNRSWCRIEFVPTGSIFNLNSYRLIVDDLTQPIWLNREELRDRLINRLSKHLLIGEDRDILLNDWYLIKDCEIPTITNCRIIRMNNCTVDEVRDCRIFDITNSKMGALRRNYIGSVKDCTIDFMNNNVIGNMGTTKIRRLAHSHVSDQINRSNIEEVSHCSIYWVYDCTFGQVEDSIYSGQDIKVGEQK